ncbi:MAG: hypothetical protein ABSE70_00885 [Candidatus Limnocylindrales bacterium]
MPAYAPMPATQPPRRDLGAALILLGIALLVVAGGIVFVALPKSSSASHVPEASATAVASPTESPTDVPTDSPTPHATRSAVATEEPTPATRTVEPAPAGTWTRYTSPDGKWSVLFPGASPKPIKMTQAIGTGAYKGDATVYAVTGQGGLNGYMVMYVDFDASLFKGIDSSTLLSVMAASMAQSAGGTVVSTSDSTVGAYPAKDETMSTKTAVYDLRMAFVGSRFYVLMAMSSPGDEIYPKYFMDSFKLK